MAVFLYVGAVVSFLYYIIIVSYAGLGTAFSAIWIAITVFLGIWGKTVDQLHRGNLILPKRIKIIFILLVLAGFSVFLFIEAILIKSSAAAPKKNADYLIALGAKVNGDHPSKTLHRRISAAREYLETNKETTVIVSGGQGPYETVTEAYAMEKVLVENGISKDRILKEEKSTNTEENIRFSSAFIPSKDASVVIVTSDFHLYRGMAIAKKQGFTNVSGCASKSDPRLIIHYYLREFFAVIKDKIKHNI